VAKVANWTGAGFDLEVGGNDEVDNVVDTGETQVVSTLPVRMMVWGAAGVAAYFLWRRWS
jgi:hypothetical protein